MKKLSSVILTFAMVISMLVASIFVSEGVSSISVYVNDEKISFDQAPIIIDGRSLVPLRAIFEAMGVSVFWDGDSQTVTSTRGGITITLQIGSSIMLNNDSAIILDVPVQLVDGRTFVPVRAIAESFGASVEWEDATATIRITIEDNNITNPPEPAQPDTGSNTIKEIGEDQPLTVSGVLSKESWLHEGTNQTHTAYILTLDEPFYCTEFAYEEKIYITEINVSFNATYDVIEQLLNQHIEVTGNPIFAHTIYHRRPIVLLDVEIIN